MQNVLVSCLCLLFRMNAIFFYISQIQWHAQLEHGHTAVQTYVDHMSAGKVLFSMDPGSFEGAWAAEPWNQQYPVQPK